MEGLRAFVYSVRRRVVLSRRHRGTALNPYKRVWGTVFSRSETLVMRFGEGSSTACMCIHRKVDLVVDCLHS